MPTLRFISFSFVGICIFLSSSLRAAQINTCVSFYQPEKEINRVFGLFEGKAGNPGTSRRVDFEKPLDDTDVYLMLNSFRNRIGVQPVEMGIVEIINGAGHVLYRGDLVYGAVARVDMRRALDDAFAAVNRFADATAIRFRHTHPPGLKGHGVSYSTWRFSPADISANQTFRDFMDKHQHLRNLDLEATIVYIDPRIYSFPTSTQAFQKISRTKAYRLEGLKKLSSL